MGPTKEGISWLVRQVRIKSKGPLKLCAFCIHNGFASKRNSRHQILGPHPPFCNQFYIGIERNRLHQSRNRHAAGSSFFPKPSSSSIFSSSLSWSGSWFTFWYWFWPATRCSKGHWMHLLKWMYPLKWTSSHLHLRLRTAASPHSYLRICISAYQRIESQGYWFSLP